MTEILRAVQIVMALVAIVCLSTIVVRRRKVWAFPELLARMGILCLLVAVLWGNAESLVTDVPGGPRTVVYTVALTWLAIGMAGLLIADNRRRALARHGLTKRRDTP